MKNIRLSENPKHAPFLIAAFLAIILITFYPFFFAGFGCGDDLHYYLITRNRQMLENAIGDGNFTGRFYHYLVYYFVCIPYFVDHFIYIKLFHYIPLIYCALIFAAILFSVTRSWEWPGMMLLMFMATIQASGETNLLVTYPLYFTLSFGLVLTSFLYLLKYFEHFNRRYQTLSVLFFAAGLLFYEIYLFYLVFFMLAVSLKIAKDQDKTLIIRRGIKILLPYMVVVAIYITIYLFFRILHPPRYSGTALEAGGINLSSFLKVLWNFSYPAIPLSLLHLPTVDGPPGFLNIFNISFENLIREIRIIWITKAVLIAITGLFFLRTMRKTTGRFCLISAIAGILLFFMPNILFGVTKKYISMVNDYNMLGYVTTFFSFFGVLILLLVFVQYLVNLTKGRHLRRMLLFSFMMLGLFFSSVLTDLNNSIILHDLKISNSRFDAMNELIKSPQFQAIPENSVFQAEALYESHSQLAPNLISKRFRWNNYMLAKSGKRMFACKTDSAFLAEVNQGNSSAYVFRMARQDHTGELLLILAETGKEMNNMVTTTSSRIILVNHSPSREFTLSFDYIRGDSTRTDVINIGNTRVQLKTLGRQGITIRNNQLNTPSTVMVLEGIPILINSVGVEKSINPLNTICIF